MYVYGTTDNGVTNGPAQIGFELDGVKGLTYTDPFPMPSSYAHNLFFSQDGLTDSNHTLKITALNEHIWTLDYIIYTTANSSVNAAALNGGNGAGGGGGANTGNPGKSKSNTGAIAGGVVGGLLGLGAFLFIGVLLLLRRRKSREASKKQFSSIDHAPVSTLPAGSLGGSVISATPATPYMIQNSPQNHSQIMAQPVQPQMYPQSYFPPPPQHPQVQYGVLPASKNSSRNPLLEQPLYVFS